MCISPFQRVNRQEIIYYISILIVYEVVFSSTFYLKFFYTGEANVHVKDFDIIYITEHLAWFVIGRMYSLGLVLSLCNRSAHQQLLNRVAALDIRLDSELRVNLSYFQLNVEFALYCAISTIYHFGDYVSEGIHNEDNLQSLIYYFGVTIAANFFYIYALYTVYWARVFVNRADLIMDAFKVTLSQRHVSKRTLAIIMELIKLLFDVRESIQNAFGSTLCIILVMNTFLVAVSTYGLIDNFDRYDQNYFYFWANYLLWCLTIWIQFIYIVVCFNKIGDVVSER